MKIHASNSQHVSEVGRVPNASTQSMPPPAAVVSETPPSHVAVSGPGQLISKLMQLKHEEPVKFQEVVSGLATSLKETAESLDGHAAKRLEHLAGQLDDIANGGDMGQLARRDQEHHHGLDHGFVRIDGDGHGFSDRDSVPPTAETPSDSATASEAPEAAPDIHHSPTLVPPAAEEAAPTLPWNPSPALLAFGRFNGHDDSDDREAMRTAFANLLQRLDTALVS